MALDISYLQDPELNAEADTTDRVKMFAVPFNSPREQEDAHLYLLDSLFTESARFLGDGISYQHYHLPILMSSGELEVSKCLVEAWIRSGFFYLYNLVLLVPEEPQALEQSENLRHWFKIFPEAAQHLCLFQADITQAQNLMESIAAYLPVQEPHLYFALGATDSQLLPAMACGFLGLSYYPRLGLTDGKNSFLIQSLQASTLACQLIETFDSSRFDWEQLQQIASSGQTFARKTLNY